MYHTICKPLKDLSFLLLGARGTGKTWLLEAELRKSSLVWIDLLGNQDFLKYQSRPEVLRQKTESALASGKQDKQWGVIDEVQRVPKILDVLFER